MRDIELPAPLRLDPWSASSLLQKSIRRGEDGLARRAGLTLYRQRGVAVFRRLSVIAVEDIGIADPSLVQEVARVTTNRALRAVLGSDADVIDDLCAKMAAATKDRSADYVFSAATNLETALQERSQLQWHLAAELIRIAADDALPLIRRAVATLLVCTSERHGKTAIRQDRVEQFLNALAAMSPPLADAVLQLATIGLHPFCLMLPLIWSQWSNDGAQFDVGHDELPPRELCDGIPLYTYDLHTAAGKYAISRFAHGNADLRAVLARSVHRERWADATAIAAFYADAAPVARRLNWSAGTALSREGFVADMIGVGCPTDNAAEVLDCVRSNLPDLNRHRRAALGKPK